MTDNEKWLREARRYAKHAYCYEGMVDEFPGHFADEFACQANPYDAVDSFAQEYDLDRADGFYGINSRKKFVKEWTA